MRSKQQITYEDKPKKIKYEVEYVSVSCHISLSMLDVRSTSVSPGYIGSVGCSERRGKDTRSIFPLQSL